MTEAVKPEIKQITPADMMKLDLRLYYAEQKYDGMLAYYTNGMLFSDRFIDNTAKYRHIANQLKQLVPAGTILVGELYIQNGNVFDVNTKANYDKARFCAFDIIQHEGLNIKDKPIEERKELVAKYIPNEWLPATFVGVDTFTNWADIWKLVVDNNWEGLVLKPKQSRYGVGWYKCKRLLEIKLEIKAYDPKESNSKGAFILEGGSRCDALSSRFKEEYEVIKASGKTPMAELEYPFLTKDGKLFQPRLRRIYAKED